jgi:hypothetical protein
MKTKERDMRRNKNNHLMEVKNMKKIIFLVLIAVASVLLLSQGTSFAIAASLRHTMHNSQNGQQWS